tara:strand:+ start:592 stop:1293 length:702 start_codon:yes stop_codon:yes gene_type:complete
MYKRLLVLIALTLSHVSLASEPAEQANLDKITFSVSSKQWVYTSSAKVTVLINATLSQSNLVKARDEITSQLNQIAKSKWHIVSFNRGQDSSGLEKLTVQAESRIAQNQLADLYKNAKTVSKPGMKYDIGSIEFTPSLEEVESTKKDLRSTLYNQVKQEIENINKVYPEQSYSVNRLLFLDGDKPQQAKRETNREFVNLVAVQAQAQDLAVSNELVMTAIAEAASNRKGKSID